MVIFGIVKVFIILVFFFLSKIFEIAISSYYEINLGEMGHRLEFLLNHAFCHQNIFKRN